MLLGLNVLVIIVAAAWGGRDTIIVVLTCIEFMLTVIYIGKYGHVPPPDPVAMFARAMPAPYFNNEINKYQILV